MRDCKEEPLKEMLQAVEQFNSGDWVAAHHTLDKLYMEERGEVRCFYQAVIQVGASLIHWQRGNFDGALKVLDRGAQHLRELPPICQGVNVADLAKGVARLRDALQSLGAERMAALDRTAIPTLKVVERRRVR